MSSTLNRIGVSLSGGGYRASAFHLGTLKKLYNMGVLHKTEIISTISGGSITGAYYCFHKDDFKEFHDSLYEKLQHNNVVREVLVSFTFLKLVLFALLFFVPAFYFLFTPFAWMFPVLVSIFAFILFLFQFQIFPVSERIEKIYDKFFYRQKTLGELPDRPVLVLGSTNLQTARAFTFSKNWMQDSTYQYMDERITFKSFDFPIARAVMASTCVPFAFTPVSIDRKYFTNPEDAKRVHPCLIDGGVYDNQGIHKIMTRGRYACDIVITSDAGTGPSVELKFRNTFTLLLETVNVFMSRIKKVQMVQDVYENAGKANKQIAYFSLGWDVENCIPGFIENLSKGQITKSVIDAHQLRPEWVENPKEYEAAITRHLKDRIDYDSITIPTPKEKKIARSVGTNLTTLSREQVDCLIKQAEALTGIQVKLYCPTLI